MTQKLNVINRKKKGGGGGGWESSRPKTEQCVVPKPRYNDRGI